LKEANGDWISQLRVEVTKWWGTTVCNAPRYATIWGPLNWRQHHNTGGNVAIMANGQKTWPRSDAL